MQEETNQNTRKHVINRETKKNQDKKEEGKDYGIESLPPFLTTCFILIWLVASSITIATRCAIRNGIWGWI